MDWLLTLFEDLQRCIKELAERSRDEDSDDSDEESSDADDERINGELKDSDDDVDEGLIYIKIKKNHIDLNLSFRKYGIFGGA
jgi:hypothetical protein